MRLKVDKRKHIVVLEFSQGKTTRKFVRSSQDYYHDDHTMLRIL